MFVILVVVLVAVVVAVRGRGSGDEPPEYLGFARRIPGPTTVAVDDDAEFSRGVLLAAAG